MNLSDLVLAEPGNQLMPAIGRIGEALRARLCTRPEASVECVLGNVNTQYSVNHFKALSSDPRSDGSASITQDLRQNASQDTVQPKQRSLEKRGRIYRSGLVAKGTPQAHRFPRHPAEMIIRRTLTTYKGRGLAVGAAPLIAETKGK